MRYIKPILLTTLLLVTVGSGTTMSLDSFDCGDIDTDGNINVFDVTYTISYLYMDGPPPSYPNLADVNNSGAINIFDVTYLISYIYMSGPEPNCPPEASDPMGTLVDATGCKTFPAGKFADSTPPNLDCIEYQYDGEGVLLLKHVNAGFNCCPVILADITIEGNLITITESETYDSLGPCYCLCLFDVNYEIINLQPGEYTIRIEELYLFEGDSLFEFTANLSSSPSGSYCVYRDHYPWGFENSPPYGNMINHTGCLPSSGKDSTLEEDCIVYEYDGSSTLLLTHLNDLFNCCPESLLADIDIENNIITITETETFDESGGCDCLCLYNLSYELVNIQPVEYTIRVDNPYYYYWYGNSEIIEFTVNFAMTPSGHFCVDRQYLPWSGVSALKIDGNWIDSQE